MDSEFQSLLTLTYRANAESWESDVERNRHVIRRMQADRHRFLRCLADEMGAYLWVREFQARGVVHYHVTTERKVDLERATEAWVRASGQVDDEAVHRHGVRVGAIRSQGGVQAYVSRYLGKERQKQLPAGVEGAGRWWGRSRSLKLAQLAEVVWLDRAEGVRRLPELQIVHTTDELPERAAELGLQVVALSPEGIRRRVAGNPRATKIDVAERLVQVGHGQVRDLIPQRPKRAALGLRPRDKYWLHLFDALAIAVAATTESART